MSVCWVDYAELDVPQQGYHAMNLVSSSRPVLLQKSPLVGRLTSEWTLGSVVSGAVQAGAVLLRGACRAAAGRRLSCYPSQASTAGGDCSVQVLCSDDTRHRFFEVDDAKNVYGTGYHLREPETQRLTMKLPEFAECAQTWQCRRVFLKVQQLAPAVESGQPAARGATGNRGTAVPGGRQQGARACRPR